MSKSLFHFLSPVQSQLQLSQVDIWQFPLDFLPQDLETLLNKEEKIRAQRYVFARHQRRFTVARAMLRLILAHYLKQAPHSLQFNYNQYGKPEVINVQQLYFNLSHSEDLAIIAVGKNKPLGIDVEFFSARPYLDIAKTLFSQQEITGLEQLPSYLRPLGFFHIWSQKEAFIKACGLGLSYPTETFDVPVLPNTDRLITDLRQQEQWRLISFMPKVACSAALCIHPSVKKINFLNFNTFSTLAQISQRFTTL